MEEFKLINPEKSGFTIYSKTNCCYCDNVKKLMENYNLFFTEINCDKYLLNCKTKQYFLEFIEKIANTSYNTFPIVFYNGNFVGGFTHTEKFVKNFFLLNNDTNNDNKTF